MVRGSDAVQTMGRQAVAAVVVEGVIAIGRGALVVAVADVGKTVKRERW